jgi:hypothetical protein
MKITTGQENYEVLDSGTIISYMDEPICFQIAADLKIVMSFKTDKDVKDQKMDYKAVGNKELEIILTNFNNTLGTGNAAPLPLAKINNRQVYLNFVVYAFDEKSNKTVHYTWYLREEVANG